MFDSLSKSSKLKPKFPLFFFEHFYFEKQFKCETILELFDSLSGNFKYFALKLINIVIVLPEEEIVIELVNENNLIISKYESNVFGFLYPRPQLRPKYSESCRSLLMDCNVWSIGPKLEFQTNTTIFETKSTGNSETDSDWSAFESMKSESQEIS